MKDLHDIRKDYMFAHLTEADLKASPFEQFELWLEEAMSAGAHEPTAMALSTVDSKGIPHSRMVLLKEIHDGGFCFFTNYESNKGQQIAQNPMVALLFFWPEVERQIRIVGEASKVSPLLSDKYFLSRPPESRIGAWASPQSRVIDPGWIDKELERLKLTPNEYQNLRPAYWGGYVVKPIEFEFWQGRPSRLHDRLRYTLIKDSHWKIERLAP
ncbi:MAG: pyridoxamine 5'-phosphate oxidase [Tannerellaceae bacterium]